MNTESFLLRENPIFEIKINDNHFEIKNDEDINDNAIYEYQNINSFNLQKRHINWLITLLSYIVDFIGFGVGNTYEEKNLLKFHYKKNQIRILLSKCDIKNAELASQIIKSKLN